LLEAIHTVSLENSTLFLDGSLKIQPGEIKKSQILFFAPSIGGDGNPRAIHVKRHSVNSFCRRIANIQKIEHWK